MGSSNTASNESPGREVALERGVRRRTESGVPAGIAGGVREPVGKIPPLSDAASKGKCWSVLAVSSAVGMVSCCAPPARIRTPSTAKSTAAFRQLPSDDFIRQSCRAPTLPDKSQEGCHCRRPIRQSLSSAAFPTVYFLRVNWLPVEDSRPRRRSKSLGCTSWTFVPLVVHAFLGLAGLKSM